MTDHSLNRFDGYSFRSYPYNFDVTSLGKSGYWGLAEDPDGKLWIPSAYQGIYSFDPYHERFVQYQHEQNNPQSLATNYVSSLTIDKNGNIWVGTDVGLDKFDKATGSFNHFIHIDHDSSTLTSAYINALILDDQTNTRTSDELWIISDKPGIDCMNKKTGKLTRHYIFPFTTVASNWKLGMELKANGMENNIIWIGSDHKGIYGFNVQSKEFIKINSDRQCYNRNHLQGFYLVMEDHSGNLWTCNDNNEIVFYDRSKNKFHFLQVTMNDIKFIDRAPMIFQDRNQKVWICTNNGLVSIDAKQKDIITCQPDEADKNSISGNFVCGFKRIKNGPLLVSSSKIQIFDKKTNSFSPFRLTENSTDINPSESLNIEQDSKENIWFSGVFGLISYNPHTKKSHSYRFHNDSANINSRWCVGVLEDRKGRYWTSNWYNGLYRFDPITSHVRVFNADGRSHSISTNNIGEVFQDSRGIIYLGDRDGGFITFDPDAEIFKIYYHDPNDPSSVNYNSCHAWLETKNGLIWFGSFGGGLGVFNPKTEKFKTFTTKDGLAHDNISSLTADSNGHYWIGTKAGISSFKPPDDPFDPDYRISFLNYDVSDGLPSNVMNLMSAYCDSDGTVYFGTRNAGMIYFHPDDLKSNDFIPPVYITEFRLNNKLVSVNDSNSVLKSPIEFTREIKLNYKQNILSFAFSALNYIHPEKNQYKYMLERYDKDWINTDAVKRFANYTNLNPGTYVFKVKGSNNDGVWNETPTEIKIIITPPFWQTTWFKAVLALSAMAIIYAFYRYRIAQLVLLQRIRNKIAADLHDDIGSTLNSIALYSDLAKKQPAQREFALNMIGENARKIIDSMSDIVWMINPKNDSFDKIVFRMRSLAHDVLKTKKIEYLFKYDETLNEISLPMGSRRNIYLIFKEALNNMIKYSRATRASVKILHENKNLILVISDNGIGFDRSVSHNGNGLINMVRRAEEIGGKINIKSEQGAGTNIELNLKL
ncbi:MAG TPA: two-component regulator propeller domain-containing protein [Chitinophagaceae bacterium]|nr:two-component regulator propeller domain-containing protein [Chitinophagaceae bacterium]